MPWDVQWVDLSDDVMVVPMVVRSVCLLGDSSVVLSDDLRVVMLVSMTAAPKAA